MTPAKVLVVDDEEIMITLLETFLKRYACRISKAADGDQAIELLESTVFDLVITDLQMGDTNGLDVIKKAKEISPETLVFMMTGCNEVEYVIAAFRSGADDYLLKPFSLVSLVESLQKKGFPLNQPGRSELRDEVGDHSLKCQKNLQFVKDTLYT